MCLIIQGSPKKITRKIIEKAFIQNPHGFGLMYISKDTGRIVSKKFFTKKLKKIVKTFDQHKNQCDQIALHFRITTQGNTNNKNCHPFEILKSENDKIDCSLMHNSPRLPSPLLTDKMSDTYYFSKIILRPILKNNYKLLENEKFIDCIDTIAQAETSSRVLLLDTLTNSFQFLGTWHEHNDLKYSNDIIIDKPKKNHYWRYDSDFYYDQTVSHYKPQPKIKIEYKKDKPIYSNDFWSGSNVQDVSTNAKDLEDFHGLVETLDYSEIKSLCKENPSLISHYLLASYSGYDLSDVQDLELYFQENQKTPIQVNDLKPISNKGANND